MTRIDTDGERMGGARIQESGVSGERRRWKWGVRIVEWFLRGLGVLLVKIQVGVAYTKDAEGSEEDRYRRD